MASDEPRIFISAAEASADLHGANLIAAVLRRRPGARFVGLAGPRMQAAGCEVLDDPTGESAMLTAAFGKVVRFWRLLRRVRRVLREGDFDAAVLIDSPALNLHVARHAKRTGVPTFYYIAPQVWAWGRFRWRRVRRWADQLACILPFEEEFFARYGIPATFVGHPLFDELRPPVAWPGTRASRGAEGVGRVPPGSVGQRPPLGEGTEPGGTRPAPTGTDRTASGGPTVALLPGSRRHVIEEVLPGQLEVAEAIARRFEAARFLISAADANREALIRSMLGGRALPAELRVGANAEILDAADLVLVASGTATLEVAWHRTPMIVMYNASRLGYHLLGRWLIRTEHLSIVNILAGRRLVPEFMPYYRSTAPIAAEAIRLLEDPTARRQMSTELDALIAPLARPGASDRTAELLLEFIDRSSSNEALA